MMNIEIWKPVVDYEEFYEVSNLGNVRSKDRKISNGKGSYIKRARVLKKSKTTTGYWKVELYKDGKRISRKVHRLVAFAFIENIFNKPNINHIDGNPLNNNVSNLEWCTQCENVIHGYETGLTPSNFRKYKDEIIGEYTNNFEVGIKELSDKYGCSQSSISKELKKNRIRVRSNGEIRNKYKIDREQMAQEFESGLSNKEIAKKHNTNSTLIATYRYKYKKGELII